MTPDFHATHYYTPNTGWGSPRPVQVINQDGLLTVIRLNEGCYFEGPRYGTRVVSSTEISPLPGR